MEPTPEDKLCAAVFALGLCMGFVRRQDVVLWADRRITEVSGAPEWLINLSLSKDKALLDLISELNQIGDGVDPLATCESAYALVPQRDGISFAEAEVLAKFIYRITHRGLKSNWHIRLLREADEIADAFCLVREGYSKLSEEQAVERLHAFVGRHRDGEVLEKLQPVGWAYSARSNGAAPPDVNATIISVSVSAWIIQDGNYRDFAVGDKARFALRFRPCQPLRPATTEFALADNLAASRYLIRGRIAFVAPDAWVIDAGTIIAFQNQKPPAFALVGSWVEGEVYIGIDPFFYLERLHRLDGMPPLSYTWLVRQVMLETTPWIKMKDATGRKYRIRDESKESYVPTRETKAWTADRGHGHYVLRCERIAGPDKPT